MLHNYFLIEYFDYNAALFTLFIDY